MLNISTPTRPIRAFRCPLDAYNLLRTKAEEGYYIYQSKRGLSPFIEALATTPWSCDPSLHPAHSNRPRGATRSVSVDPSVTEDYAAILSMYGVNPINNDPSTILGTVFTNLSTGFLFPSSWPSRATNLPESIAAALYESTLNTPLLEPTKDRITAALEADSITALLDLVPPGPLVRGSAINVISNWLTHLATQQVPLQDTRPSTLKQLSDAYQAMDLPPVWRDPLKPQARRSQQITTFHLPPHTISYLLTQAETYNISPRTSRRSQNTIICALLEAMADGYLTPQPTLTSTTEAIQ
jgi:hypothetical protein